MARCMAVAPRRNLLARLLPGGDGEQFFDLFEQHAALTREAATLLAAMVRDGADPGRQAERVKDVEHQGDEITHRLIERLHSTYITPLDRVYASAERIRLYDIVEMEAEAGELAEVLRRAVEAVGAAVHGLRDLRDRTTLIAHCTEINRLENEGDQLLRRAVARLFRERRDPIHVLKWKEIYDYLEEAIDRCEDVANVIEGVALEYA